MPRLYYHADDVTISQVRSTIERDFKIYDQVQKDLKYNFLVIHEEHKIRYTYVEKYLYRGILASFFKSSTTVQPGFGRPSALGRAAWAMRWSIADGCELFITTLFEKREELV